jgi:hypothetical protein
VSTAWVVALLCCHFLPGMQERPVSFALRLHAAALRSRAVVEAGRTCALPARPLRARDRASAWLPLAHAKRGAVPAVGEQQVTCWCARLSRISSGAGTAVGTCPVTCGSQASRRRATTADGTMTMASCVLDEVVGHAAQER